MGALDYICNSKTSSKRVSVSEIFWKAIREKKLEECMGNLQSASVMQQFLNTPTRNLKPQNNSSVSVSVIETELNSRVRVIHLRPRYLAKYFSNKKRISHWLPIFQLPASNGCSRSCSKQLQPQQWDNRTCKVATATPALSETRKRVEYCFESTVSEKRTH